MSAKAYDGKIGDKVGDYTLANVHSDDTGLRAALFIDKAGNSVLAFAGTDFTSLADWKANILQGMGIESTQYTNAIELAKGYSLNTGGKISFTGHSLGGGLASAAAIHTGGSATVFNAAGLHNNILGPYQRANGSITHYYSGYDAISAINAFTPSSVPGTQINLGHGGWHDMGSMCKIMGTSC
ncbi:Protein of unknown function [Ferrimonas sediminum]|uniref:Lipase (Class 3) n=1 Tax=Ferrimonas sediminum TaxID=718193 RepID=A0A1G9AI68_9GAMM|nr:Mbeg1-like protein [Ferrimonas sediminum]SDK26514.1 Protein of unknown function [Ferrimonas sediminum]